MTAYAGVIINLSSKSLDRIFTYIIPNELEADVKPGSFVEVPFGKRNLVGVVVDVALTPPLLPENARLKPLIRNLYESSAWQYEMVNLALWMKQYYGCTLLEALKTSFPANFFDSPDKKPAKKRTLIALADNFSIDEARETLKRMPRQMLFLEDLYCSGKKVMEKRSSLPVTVLNALVKRGFIKVWMEAEKKQPLPERPGDSAKRHLLTAEQSAAVDRIMALAEKDGPSVALLHGVTGSGKTEVYLSVIEKILDLGKNAVVLIPEISLTPQYADRFRARFGDLVALLHSGFSKGQRVYEWNRLISGEARIALGARSAVFAPLANIGIIIVDEEHEGAYKQESQPRYHARHLAVKRGMANSSVVVLGSATPSMESYFRATEGRYHFISLPNRVRGSLPEVKIVDMRKSFNRSGESFFSPYLIKEARKNLEKGHQIILFINRRGYFNYLYCQDCGFILSCRNCEIALRFHKNPAVLRCHYCSLKEQVPEVCPKCRGFNISSKGGGTQRIEEEIAGLFPDYRILRIDSDSAGKKKYTENAYDLFNSGKADILVGTQMIAKGLDFPNVMLVGVVLADSSFSMPDFRAAERTYQLLAQVGGRAGRGQEGASFVVQTYNPEHPAIEAISSGAIGSFYKMELSARKELMYPPFTHMLRIVASSADVNNLEKSLNKFSAVFSVFDDDVLTGPAPCPLFKLNGLYRYQFYLRTKNVLRSVSELRKAFDFFSAESVTFFLDVDTFGFL